MKSGVLLLTLALFCGTILYTEGCSCMPSHPQEQFCKSDFVILARVKRERIFNQTFSKVYKVRVRKEFKVSEKGVLALKSGRLNTPMYDSMCGVQLELGKLYVISGRIFSLRAHVNMCGMIMPWESLTRRQRKGLRLLYGHGCSCGIQHCVPGRRCHHQRDSCNWRSHCEEKEGICLRQPKACVWARTQALSKCTKDWRRTMKLNPYHRYSKPIFDP
ncbi:tissue inhibitor of metalloproteinase [Leptinotarsa decemlineata]|uniref:tissue inhibitor of metalloproteinase n=1 Tax=Leptinotarsa decemlineata TaxID=7539 RepID=UPI003D308D77